MGRPMQKPDPLSLILPGLLLAVWAIASGTGSLPAYLVPSPARILTDLGRFLAGSGMEPYAGELMMHSLASFSRVAGGFSLAVLLGVPLGVLAGRIRIGRRILDPLIHLIRMIPGIGWLPLAMVWFGVGTKTAVFLIALAAFFPVYLNTAAGTRDIPEELIQAARVLGARGRILLFRVILPAAAGGILTGLRTGLGISWAYLVLGELTGVNRGLGAVMMDARMLGNTGMILVSMVVIAFWGRLSDRILVLAFHGLHPAGTEKENMDG